MDRESQMVAMREYDAFVGEECHRARQNEEAAANSDSEEGQWYWGEIYETLIKETQRIDVIYRHEYDEGVSQC